MTGSHLGEHLFVALAADEGSICGRVAREQCPDLKALFEELSLAVSRSGQDGIVAGGGGELEKLLRLARAEAGDGVVRPQHLFLATLHSEHPAIAKAGITLIRSRAIVEELS